jgi:hypothetical protein
MKKKGIILLFSCCFFIAFTGCNHNKADLVYPACDDSTVVVSLKNDLTPIMAVNCFNCHSAENARIIGGGYNLQDYVTIKGFIDTTGQGLLISAIQHDTSLPSYMFMPRDGGMLSDCEINKFINWVKQDAPNN